MPNELTRLLKVASRGPRTTCAALFTPDLACTALCAIFKVFSYWLKYFILFHPQSQVSFIFVLILCEILDSVVSVLWLEIALSFEAAVFKGAHAAFIDPKQSNETKKAATKANRKGASIPNAIRASLELVVDQSMISFAAFSKAGCSPLFACGASAAMLCFPLVLQLRSIRFMAQVSAYQRQKESDVDTENTLRIYLKASRALRLMESGRRICVLFAFIVLVFIANPKDLQAFVLVLSLILRTDEKLAKLWKALADTEPAWVFLHTQNPLPDQGAHQEITYNSISHPKPASEVVEARERMQVPSEASWAAQVLRMWKEGYEYKTEMTETTTGLRLSRKRLGDDADEV